jgi:DNA-directed RNA polymerase I, II, and III subunit RPABC4
MSTQQTNTNTTDDLETGPTEGATSRFGAGSSSTGPSAVALADQMSAPVTYRCGDCNASVPLKRDDPVRCIQCGYRVLYKERTKR